MFFSAHWRGEHSLPVSYWLNFVALGFLCGILLSWWVNNVEVVLSPYLRPDGIWYALLAGFVLYVAFVVWAIVGVWRAAGKSIEKGRRGWPWIARFIVSAAACLFVYNFYAGITGAPLLVSSQDRAVDRATMPSVASVLKAIEGSGLTVCLRKSTPLLS